MLLAQIVSDNYFTLMGVRPELGRLPDENELRRLQAPIIVLGHGTWKRLFAGNPGIIGQTVKVNRRTATVVAVLPAVFQGTARGIDPPVYVPLSTLATWNPSEQNEPRTIRDLELYARLRKGATLGQTKAQLRSLSADLSAKYPQANSGRTLTAYWQTSSPQGLLKISLIKTFSILLLAVAGSVLMIACANIANLLRAVNDARRKEIAMRTALGASRPRLLRQLITEYAVLAAVGVAGALALAKWVITLVPALIPDIGFPLGFDFRIDHRVLAFTAAAGVFSVLVCGLLPALTTTRTSPLDAMRAQTVPRGKLRTTTRKLFVVAEIAVSMALLMATGLLLRTLMHIETTNMGFNSNQNAVLMGIAVDGQRGPRRQAETDALVARMRALPGVKDATVARGPIPRQRWRNDQSRAGARRASLGDGGSPCLVQLRGQRLFSCHGRAPAARPHLRTAGHRNQPAGRHPESDTCQKTLRRLGRCRTPFAHRSPATA
jgi:macrolide transport system ATP-binding/permease protein